MVNYYDTDECCIDNNMGRRNEIERLENECGELKCLNNTLERMIQNKDDIIAKLEIVIKRLKNQDDYDY